MDEETRTEAPEAGVEEAPAAPPAAESSDGEALASEAASAVESDLEELQRKAAERDEFLALAQRTQADFENFRKRAAREQGAAEARGVTKVVRELLPALDNLERALAAAESQPDHGEHHLAEGIRLVQAEIVAAMNRVGVEGYSPKGERFDPNVHEAMAQQPVDGAESGTIVEVFQSGYRIGESVIRPARVVVAA
ncbi:MAG TPA: nucleotide exchange factor GrpE [Solirubrobacteraceae bacterium]